MTNFVRKMTLPCESEIDSLINPYTWLSFSVSGEEISDSSLFAKEKSRRSYVSQWYGNIHEGRFFLFFKENDIFEEKLFNDFRYSQTTVKSICDIGRRAQVSQDFLTLDGGGLGEKPGKIIEHIDDIFKKI